LLDIALDKLQECVKKKILNFSSIREAVLKEIAACEKGLCGEEIHKRVNEKSQKKVSFNTVYRVLRLLEECEIVVTIQSDFKRTHYFLATSSCKTYLLDKNSNYLVPVKNSSLAKELLKEHGLEDTKSFVVIHKNC
jgi:Fe2+ or Zn2+ uptake regulation protein